jgi:hypothetical protein
MNKINIRIGVFTVLILIAAFSRIIPHPYNFSPLVAIALFGGSQFKNKFAAMMLPVMAYFVSDISFAIAGGVGFYGISQFFVYGAMLIVTILGMNMKDTKPLRVLGYTLSGSAIFWMISNFGVWAANYFANGTAMYEPGLTLGLTYLRALPFYNTYSNELFFSALCGDIFYSALIFGAFSWIQRKFPALRYHNV